MNVKFEENQIQSLHRLPREKSGLVGFLIKKDIAKDESQANMMLLSIFVACLVIMFILFLTRGSDSYSGPILSEEELLEAGNSSEVIDL